MYGLIQFARSLAITDATTVIFCVSTNLESCTDDDNFANGAIVMSQNNDGSRSLVRVVDPIDTDDFYVQLFGFPTNTEIQFSDTGEILNMTTAGSITFCDPRGTEEGSALIVNPLGMVRQATDDDNDEIINLHDQSNMLCG
jgi:Tfp pilus assembly protein FimT